MDINSDAAVDKGRIKRVLIRKIALAAGVLALACATFVILLGVLGLGLILTAIAAFVIYSLFVAVSAARTIHGSGKIEVVVLYGLLFPGLLSYLAFVMVLYAYPIPGGGW